MSIPRIKLNHPLWLKENKRDFCVFFWCLTKCLYKNQRNRYNFRLLVANERLSTGCFLTNKTEGARECLLTSSSWYRSIKRLKKANFIDLKTTHLGTYIYINNLQDYCHKEEGVGSENEL